MQDIAKTKDQLLEELTAMRQRLTQMENSELKMTREYLENVLENSPECIGIVDKHGRLIKWNRMAAELYGYSFEELKGKKAFELYADPQELNKMLSQLRQMGVITKYEINMKKKDGSIAPFELSISLLKDDDNETIGSVCVSRDLSDIKKALTAVRTTNEQLNQEIIVRQRVEDELRQTRDCLENIFENSPDVIGIVDRHGKFIKWNRMAVELYGFRLEELEGIKAFDLYDNQNDLNDMLMQLRHDGVVKKCEINMKRKDGNIIPFEISIGLLKDKRNNTTGSVCVARDLTGTKKALAILRETNERLNQEIVERQQAEEALQQAYQHIEQKVQDRTKELVQTNKQLSWEIEERRRIEKALRKSENKYRTLVENLPQKIFLKDKNSVYSSCNENFARDLGISPEEVRGKTDYDFVPEALAEKYRADDKRILESGNTEEIEETYIHQGQEVFIQTVKTPVKDGKGKIIGILGIFWDITARRRAEEAFKTLVLNAPIGLFIARDGRFRQINPEFEKITGYSEEELLNDDCLCLVIPEFREKVKETALQILQGKRTLPFEFQYRTKGGDIRWALEKVATTQYEGERGTLGYFMDITDSKHLEVQFLQAQKMEAVGRLAGGVAHDFNNLLTGILGYGELLSWDLPEDHPRRRYVDEIIKTTERAAALTQQLLAFGRKQIIQPRIISLNEVISGMEKMLRRLLGEDLDLVTLLEPDLAAVKADPGQMDQVIMNLAVNARDAMPRGGLLTLKTENVFLDEAYIWEHMEAKPGPYVMLAVSDSGSGMDPETKAHIFEPFFTTKEPGKGTGLGLATVHGIIKQSDGHVWVYSEPGKGTTFKIYLPRVEAPAISLQPVTAPAASLRGQETILVAEDEEKLRGAICQILRSYGYRVLEAGHGQEALLLCGRHQGPLHLVLTDVVMPGMSGGELIERLTSFGRQIKVLFMSGYTADTAALQSLLAAGVPFLEKPFKMMKLLQKVREVLDTPAIWSF
ncbi:MAG: PAS domain S-box protein [Desulfobaccales bacterium]